jgi:hypothetical protein
MIVDPQARINRRRENKPKRGCPRWQNNPSTILENNNDDMGCLRSLAHNGNLNVSIDTCIKLATCQGAMSWAAP